MLLPHLIQNDDGSFGVVILHPDNKGSTAFHFANVEYLNRSEVNSHVEAMIDIEGITTAYSGRLNLASISSREAFARAMGRISKNKQEFDSYLSAAITAVYKKLNETPFVQSVTEIPPITGNMMLFDPFITDKSANLIFGDGSSTKSYICIHLAISLVSGLPFAGFKPARKINVLYFDYEDIGGKFSDRVHRVASGMAQAPSLEDLANLKYMKPRGRSLEENVTILKEVIAKHKIELIIIDSAAYACGAEIEKADAVIRYFNALDKLGIASLAIAHVTKSSVDVDNKMKGQQHAIGSIYFHNGPRNIWNVVKQGDENDQDSVKKVCMFHRKCNDAKLSRFVPLEVDFSKTSCTSIRVGDEKDWEEARTIQEKILSYLRGGLRSKKDIDQEFSEESKETVKSALRRLKAAGKITQFGGDRGDYGIA